MNPFDRILRPKNKVYIECGYSMMYVGRVINADNDVIILNDAHWITIGNLEDILRKGEVKSFYKFPSPIEIERNNNLKFATIYPHRLPSEEMLVDAFFPIPEDY